MGINERERQALRSIEDRLAGSDPPLASMLAKFARLTSGEEMPAWEKIRARSRQVLTRRVLGRQRRERRRPHRAAPLRPAHRLQLARGWQPAMLVLIIFAGLLAVALVLGTTGHPA
jgi:hypothetical protein